MLATMKAIRSDAVRSRERILEVACTHDRGELRLNEIAREAGVGVGTVYRHFPTVHALVEALSITTIERMVEFSRRALAEPDVERAFSSYLRAALELQLEDGGLQVVLLADADESQEVRAAKQEILHSFDALLRRAQKADAVRPDLTPERLSHLICGIEHAVRLGRAEDREPLLQILLNGLRPEPVRG